MIGLGSMSSNIARIVLEIHYWKSCSKNLQKAEVEIQQRKKGIGINQYRNEILIDLLRKKMLTY